MKTAPHYLLRRRQFLQAALVSSVIPTAWANPCSDPPEAIPGLPRGPFGRSSTAEEVTEGMDLSGLRVVITGCNSGLGYETMRVLTMRGAHVIGTARNAEKAMRATSSVKGRATPVVLELSDLDSVRAGAKTINDMNLPIDALICNAGIMALPELKLANGIELQFAVNHLGHFVFANELLERVKQAEQGRVVMLSSCAHFFAPEEGIDFDNLDGSKSYHPWRAYGRSKLANVLYAAELSRRLKGTNVTANSLHPGVIKTNLGRDLDRDPNDDSRYDKSIPQGASTQTYVAVSPIVTPISGQYFVDCNPAPASEFAADEKLAAKLWEVSEELTS